jgi:RNA polymerase sigma-70 factor (ECF subfamily)
MEEAFWNPSSLQDRVLVSRSQSGDPAAFEDLISKYRPQLSSLVGWYAGPSADAEDILQLILCKVYFSLKSFDINRPFYPWLRRIAVNRCCDERRRLRRRRVLTFAELDLEETCRESELPPLQAMADSYYSDNRQRLHESLRAVIEKLPEEHRQIILLRHLQQCSYEEIGESMMCTPRAARVKACRARTALKKLILKSAAPGPKCSPSANFFQRFLASYRNIDSTDPRAARYPRLPAQSNSRRYVMRAE